MKCPPARGSRRVRARASQATRVALACVLGQRPRQHRVEVRELGSAARYARWWRGKMVADDDSTIRVLKGWRTGQQVKCGGSQRILVRPAIERPAQELLGGDVADGSQRDVVVGEVADVIDVASDAEVGQQHPAPTAIGCGHQDVLGLDITMEQTAVMCRSRARRPPLSRSRRRLVPAYRLGSDSRINRPASMPST